MALLQSQECDGVREAMSLTKRKHFLIFDSIVKSTIKPIISSTKALNEASRLCFGAFAVCLVVGILGWIVNLLVAGTTMLHGLLVVAVFYFALGIIHFFDTQTSSSNVNEQKCDLADHASARDGDLASEGERLEPAA